MKGIIVGLYFDDKENFDIDTARGLYYFNFGVKLCNENQNYTLARESYVAYKGMSGGHFILAKQKAGTYIASNSTFGQDPQNGVKKEAYIVDIISRARLPDAEAYTTTDGKLWTQLYRL